MTMRIALVNGDNPYVALQQAGYVEETKLLTAIFGEIGRDKLTVAQREYLAMLDGMDNDDRRHYLSLGRSLSGRRRKR